MDTTTRKQEALSLLALLDKGDELTRAESERLTYLTIEQGYPTIAALPVEMEKYREADPVHWYHIHVDNCLMLPIPDGWFWKTRYPVLIRAELYSADGQRVADSFARSLPVAMLKTWWTLHP